MNDEFLQWLRTQLDNDERIAKDAARKAAADLATADRRADSFAPPYDGSHWGHDWDHVLMRDPRPDRARKVTIADCGHGAVGLVTHIAEHDPARVLAEVAARREVIDAYERMSADAKATEDDGAALWALALLSALRHLAVPYADRLGYRDEWRP